MEKAVVTKADVISVNTHLPLYLDHSGGKTDLGVVHILALASLSPKNLVQAEIKG